MGEPKTEGTHPDQSLKLKFPLAVIICFTFELDKLSIIPEYMYVFKTMIS